MAYIFRNWGSAFRGGVRFIAGALLGAAFFFVRAEPLEVWTKTNPTLSSDDIATITYVDGEFLAAAPTDGVLISNDGTNWNSRPMEPAGRPILPVTSVSHGNGVYVAVGYPGLVLSSTNGIDWVPSHSGVTAPLLSVAFGRGRFVAVGGPQRAILTSEDGINWIVRQLSEGSALNKVVFDGVGFFAVGDRGAIVSSFDGIAWTEFTSLNKNRLTSIASGNGTVVVVGSSGQFLISADRNSWSTNGPALQTALPSVAFGNGKFVILDDLKVWVSSDGENWTAQFVDGLSSVASVAYGAGRFVAVGSQGRISTSSDGLNGTLQTTAGQAIGIDQIAVGGGVTLGIGDGYVLMRDIKARWRPSATFPGAYEPFFVMYGNEQFILFTRLRTSPSRVFALTSLNGLTWTATEVKSTGAAARMIYVKGEYLGVGGGVFHSADGMNWTVQPVGYPNALSAVAFGNDRYVAIGTENRAFISSNGTDWKSGSTGTHWLTDIVFGEGKFVAIGNDFLSSGGGSTLTGQGEILTSIDGENWEVQTTPFGPTTKTALGGITYGGGWFVVVGGQGLILTSADGMHWDTIDSPTRQLLNAVSYSEGVFTAAGRGGTMLVSGNVLVSTLSAPKLQKEGFGFMAAGGRGQVYQIQSTIGLTPPNWTELARVTNATGNVRFLDPAVGQTDSRFYRVMGLP